MPPAELDRTFNKYGIEEVRFPTFIYHRDGYNARCHVLTPLRNLVIFATASLSSLVDVAHLTDVLRPALKILRVLNTSRQRRRIAVLNGLIYPQHVWPASAGALREPIYVTV
jgi:hypothetical protein